MVLEDAFEVRVQPLGRAFAARAGQSLLEAALAAGVPLPSSCRNGSCRTCLARLAGGRIAYRVEWPGVSAGEKAAGWILPCVAQPRSDVVLELPAKPAGWF